MEMNMIHDWVKVGAEIVTEPNKAWLPYGPIRKIVKVYKNGNFLIEGVDGQFKPWNDHASRTGPRVWSASRLVPVTSAVRAAMEKNLIYMEARKFIRGEVERLNELFRRDDEDEIIAEAKRLKP